MKTIKQVADELGVSKEAIRKRIRQLDLQTELQKVGNRFALNDYCVEKVILSFSETKNANQNDLQVVDLLAALKESQEALKREQMLHMATQQRLAGLLEAPKSELSRWERLKAAWKG